MRKDKLHAFLRSRRSIRRFKPEPVPPECIQRILETAIYAPSAHNLQPWRFTVLSSPTAKIHLAEAITGKYRQDMVEDRMPEAEIQSQVERTIRRINEAPLVVILCRDSSRVKTQPDPVRQQREDLMSIQSVASVGLQLLLAVHAEGLGGTWICWPLFAPDETRLSLGLPKEWEPQGMFFIGYPDKTPELPERIPIKEVTIYI